MAPPNDKSDPDQSITTGFGQKEVGKPTVPCSGPGSLSLDDPDSLRGADPKEVEKLIPPDWVKSETKGEGGFRYANPKAKGEQIRIMPGKTHDPTPAKQGPYMRISKNGKVSDPIPLKGNPTLAS